MCDVVLCVGVLLCGVCLVGGGVLYCVVSCRVVLYCVGVLCVVGVVVFVELVCGVLCC